MIGPSARPGEGATERRFVVSEHTVRPGDVHWDLMVEDGAALVTFQLAARPGPGRIRGKRLPDHRLAYLEHEGPVSNDRGVVAIRERGRVVDLGGGPREPRWRARLRAEGPSGQVEVRLLEVEPGEGDAVEVTFAPEPA